MGVETKLPTTWRNSAKKQSQGSVRGAWVMCVIVGGGPATGGTWDRHKGDNSSQNPAAEPMLAANEYA